MKSVAFVSGLLSILAVPAAAAPDMLAQCLIDYPAKVEWCKSQYSSEAKSAAQTFHREFDEKAAANYDDLTDLRDARQVLSRHLADRSIARRIEPGQKITTTGRMGCFRFGPGEYRCVSTVMEYGAVVTAPTITGETAEYIDRNCHTLIRGMKSPDCGFLVTFRVAARGVDHMEQVQLYQAERMHLRRLNQ